MEAEAAAQEMFPSHWIAERSALFRGGSLVSGLDLLHFGVVHLSEIDRILFETGQDDGVNELGIGGHYRVL